MIYKLTGRDYGTHVQTFYLADPQQVANMMKRLEDPILSVDNQEEFDQQVSHLAFSRDRAKANGKERLAARRQEEIDELYAIFDHPDLLTKR